MITYYKIFLNREQVMAITNVKTQMLTQRRTTVFWREIAAFLFSLYEEDNFPTISAESLHLGLTITRN